MKRFILPEQPDHTGMIRLSGGDYHYLARVRRFKVGALFHALLPTGTEVRVQVRSIDRDCLTGVCLSSQEQESGGAKCPVLPVVLFQGMPKMSKMDIIVRQAAEGGIAEIIPFISERSIPKPAPSDTGKTGRWVKIIKEARQQSGSDVATSIRSPGTLHNALGYWEALKIRYSRVAGILLHEAYLEPGGFHNYLACTPDLVAVAVGPEGGFSPDEVARLCAAGFKPLTLGTPVLRTETAAVYAAAAVRVILLEGESWTLKIP
jgi:16S rRNA (uracil1498-N3)-methyltransferase